MALAPRQGEAAGIRANARRTFVIHDAVDLPVVGLFEVAVPGYAVYITPTLADACAVAEAGAAVVANRCD
jgi:N-acylglucosamine-6-phosphate 2-epimerase